MELRLTVKMAFAAIGSPSEEESRVGPGPRYTMQAPFEAILVPLLLTHSPRVV